MLEIVKNPSINVFMGLIQKSNDSICLCSPFIKEKVVDEILKLKQENTDLKVITSSSIPAFLKRLSDIEAIEKLLSHGVKVYIHQKFNANIYAFDKQKALITSSNLTADGLVKNYEYGVLIDDKEQVDVIYQDLFSLISDDLSGEFRKEDVDFISYNINKLKNESYTLDKYSNYDDLLVLKTKNNLNNLTGWQKLVFEVVIDKMEDVFTLPDIYRYERYFKENYPRNNNIKDKIRQSLQYLRNKGLIKFEGAGVYKKLVKIK